VVQFAVGVRVEGMQAVEEFSGVFGEGVPGEVACTA
jgi:hypothetical protein